jgi:DNA-binding IclR family transcriptional regulator
LCIANDPGIRLRDIAAAVGITERSAYGIVTDLTTAGYVIKERDGRRNRYHVQAHLPLGEPITRERTIGDLLDVLLGNPQDPSHLSAAVAAPTTTARRRRAARS